MSLVESRQGISVHYRVRAYNEICQHAPGGFQSVVSSSQQIEFLKRFARKPPNCFAQHPVNLNFFERQELVEHRFIT